MNFYLITISIVLNLFSLQKPDEFIENYKSAFSNIQTIEYSFIAERGTVVISGEVKFKRGANHNTNQYYFDGSVVRGDDYYQLSFSDNNEGYYLDKESEFQHFDDFSSLLFGAGLDVVHLVVNGALSPNPAYGLIKDSDVVSLVGAEKVGDVSCKKYEVQKSNGTTQILFIGENDFLLRRLITSNLDLMLTIKSVNEEITDESFDLETILGKNSEKGGVLAIGSTVPEFKLPDLNGQSVHSRDFAGKITILDFWGTWCKPCINEIPELNKLYASVNKDEVQYFGISSFEEISSEDLIDFVESKGINYPILQNGELIAEQFGIFTYPTMIILDKQARVIITRGSNGSMNGISIPEITELIRNL